jgi:hypothetical protein
MTDRKPVELRLSETDEEILAAESPEERVDRARLLLKREGHESVQRSGSERLAAGDERVLRAVVAWGLALVIVAGVLLAATFIPEATTDSVVRLASGIGVVGLAIACIALLGEYVAGGASRLDADETSPAQGSSPAAPAISRPPLRPPASIVPPSPPPVSGPPSGQER